MLRISFLKDIVKLSEFLLAIFVSFYRLIGSLLAQKNKQKSGFDNPDRLRCPMGGAAWQGLA
jgi:hypothetical protein